MYASFKRAWPRLLVLFCFAIINLLLSEFAPRMLGPTVAPVMFGVGLTFMGLFVGDIALRILQPNVDGQLAAEEALNNSNTAAGLVYLGRCILAGVILMLTVTASRAQTPQAALPYLPLLVQEQQQYWPGMKKVSVLAAQVEQETCISLTHRFCWNPKAELRTSREQGVGLGQLTRTFRANGTTRFDSLTEIAQQNPQSLAQLTWSNRYNPQLQLRALVIKDKGLWENFASTKQELDRLAFTFAAYNGGYGSVLKDKRACAGTKGCDVTSWFGHVEHTSLKARARVAGYGKSFFEINREYPRNILFIRQSRYKQLDAA